jgi:hypothetical protein
MHQTSTDFPLLQIHRLDPEELTPLMGPPEAWVIEGVPARMWRAFLRVQVEVCVTAKLRMATAFRPGRVPVGELLALAGLSGPRPGYEPTPLWGGWCWPHWPEVGWVCVSFMSESNLSAVCIARMPPGGGGESVPLLTLHQAA